MARLQPAVVVAFILCLALLPGMAQKSVPDAPSASKPPQPVFPADTAPAPKVGPQKVEDMPQTPTPATQAPAQNTPPPVVDRDNRSDLFTLRTGVNLVLIPVTVKAANGTLVDGLLRSDFRVFENEQEQPISFFTSDPFPLSAAIVLDQSLPNVVMERVNRSLDSLTGAFAEFDEVALYSYGNTVEQNMVFGAPGDRLSAGLKKVKRRGNIQNVPVTSGPLASGPTVNGRPLDPGAPRVVTPTKESNVLNDAILRAAVDLSRRDPTRRRVIFVVSNGNEQGSSAQVGEVLKVLLTNDIAVYALGVGTAALPGYKQLERMRIPGTGRWGNVLPQYARATGGELFDEFTSEAMAQAYARITEVARNQYTLGYSVKSSPSGEYRRIDVRVKRSGVQVFARDGYYPLPPSATREKSK